MSATWSGVSPARHVPAGTPRPRSWRGPSRRACSMCARNAATSGSAGAVARSTSISGVILGADVADVLDVAGELGARIGLGRDLPGPATLAGVGFWVLLAGHEPRRAGGEQRRLGPVREIDRLHVHAGFGCDRLHRGRGVAVAGEQTGRGLFDPPAGVRAAAPLAAVRPWKLPACVWLSAGLTLIPIVAVYSATTATTGRDLMRVLCSTTPMDGVFGPFIPLGRAFVERGHEVIVASGANLQAASLRAAWSSSRRACRRWTEWSRRWRMPR